MTPPLKAYYVEKVQRTVTTLLVHADTAQDARRRANRGEGQPIDSETRGTGTFGKVYRAQEEDTEDR